MVNGTYEEDSVKKGKARVISFAYEDPCGETSDEYVDELVTHMVPRCVSTKSST